jgi:methionyl-tRNA formyltransferase
LRVVFAGTPDFAAIALAHLLSQGHRVTMVLTQPDRPAGRGMKLQASPVKGLALQHGIGVLQPHSLRLDGRYSQEASQARTALLVADADVMIVAAYGLLLPQWVLDDMQVPREDHSRRLGCLNIHASLLPRWRGAAPIQRAIAAGDSHTGITIMQMDAGLDTGAMLLQRSLAIAPGENAASLHDRLARLGAEMAGEALRAAQTGTLSATAQDPAGVTYAEKITKQEAQLDWNLPAPDIVHRVNAFNPFPVARTGIGGEVVRVWAARIGEVHASIPAAPAGTVLACSAQGIAVSTGDEGSVLLTELQRAGARRLRAADFLRGFDIAPGQRLDFPGSAD